MKKCVIFCAGGFDGLIEPLTGSEYIIAADGGLRHTQALGVYPHHILGDFDSLGYAPAGANVFPVEKDDTDAMLAVKRGLKMGCREFLLYGCLDGPRLDHTLAALQTLQYLSDHGATGYLIGCGYIAALVTEGTLYLPENASGILSVFALNGAVPQVTLRNLQYPLENEPLTGGFPLGVSNHFIGKPASVTAMGGSLLVLYDRENGLPKQERR